jgi:REP element-mobilizing transposase RayT
MPRPRKALVSLDATPYYHCVSRCVRKAYLCGKDTSTGKDYEHRRQWLEDKLLNLAQVFSIDLCAYAVMHNHYHVVLYINQDRALGWSGVEVVEHWHQLFAGTALTQRYAKGDRLDTAELDAVEIKIEQWREQLMDISWFMRCTNEGIARDSNKEDNCSGRFWEGRFKSQALLDEQALAACMAYVDLNPIRAKMDDTPEKSEHTSVKRRCDSLEKSHGESAPQQPDNLFPFVGNPRESMPVGLPFHLKDYLELVDWTGRIIREDKRGAISDKTPPILDRLNIDVRHWLFLATKFESQFKTLVGTACSVKHACEVLQRKRVTHAVICQI